MKLDNVQTLMDFLMKNADKLSAGKIEAFSKVMEAVKDYQPIESSPNQEFKEEEEIVAIPIDLSEVTGIQIDDQKPVSIYGQKEE